MINRLKYYVLQLGDLNPITGMGHLNRPKPAHHQERTYDLTALLPLLHRTLTAPTPCHVHAILHALIKGFRIRTELLNNIKNVIFG